MGSARSRRRRRLSSIPSAPNRIDFSIHVFKGQSIGLGLPGALLQGGHRMLRTRLPQRSERRFQCRRRRADRTATGFPFEVTTKSFSRARQRHTVADRLHKSRMLTNSTISVPGLLGALSRTRQSLYATATSINPRQPPLRRAGRMNARSCSVSRPQLRPTSTPQAALPAVAAIPRSLSSTGSSNGRDASAPTSSIRTRRTPPWRPRIGRGRFARMWPPAPPRTDRENTGTPPWISWTRQGAAR